MATSCVTRNRAFTLVEVLVGIAVVSALASVGYVTVGNVREGARENKLQADVISINAAVQAYLGNGGKIPDDATAETVIAKLKTRANDAIGAQMMGVKGSFLDARVQPDLQSGDEAGGAQLRAVWNAAQKRFVLAREGSGGIKSFNLDGDASAEPAKEARTVNLKASDVTSGQPVWVWDHAENVAAVTDPGAPPQGGATASLGPVVTATTTPLSPPIFSVATGTYDVVELEQFYQANQLASLDPSGAFSVKVTDPNPPGVSTLSSGSTVAVAANSSAQPKNAYAHSLDPDVWRHSGTVTETYSIKPYDLTVTLQVSGSITPFSLGIQPAVGAAGTSSVTATITNWDQIHDRFRTPANFQLVMATGAQNPTSLSGPAQASSVLALTTSSGWNFSNGNPTLPVTGLAKATNTTLFSSGSNSTTLNVTRPELELQFTPGNGTILNASETITITPVNATQFPADYYIRYTADGSDPTPATGSLYNPGSPIIPTASGEMTLKAAAFSSSYSSWFVSVVETASYTVNAQSGDSIPAGALVSFAELQNNVQFHGSMMIAERVPQGNITLFGNSRIVGNMYVPGTPLIFKSHRAYSQWDNQLWSLQNDPNFANYILGKQFDEQGNLINPPDDNWSASPRVIDLNGEPNPSGYNSNGQPISTNAYNILIQDSAKVEGKIYRRATPPPLPTVSNPGTKTNNVSRSYHSWTLDPNNPSRYSTTVNPAVNSGVSLTTNASLTLLPGNYGSVTASNNGRLVLGDPDNPDTVQYYSFEQLSLTGGAGIEVVGKVVVTLKFNGWASMEIHNNGFFGNPDHPEWLQLNVYSTSAPSENTQHVLVASGGAFYGRINAPKGRVTIQEQALFNGAVTAYKLHMTGSAGVNINFSLPPVIE